MEESLTLTAEQRNKVRCAIEHIEAAQRLFEINPATFDHMIRRNLEAANEKLTELD